MHYYEVLNDHNQDLAKKMSGTYFFLNAEIPNFTLKNL